MLWQLNLMYCRLWLNVVSNHATLFKNRESAGCQRTGEEKAKAQGSVQHPLGWARLLGDINIPVGICHHLLACHDRAKSVPRPVHRRLEMGPGDKDQSHRLKVQLEPSHVTRVFVQKHRTKMFCNSILFEWSTVARPARRSDTLRIKSCMSYSLSRINHYHTLSSAA